MNFRKAKVSKATWLLAPVLGLLVGSLAPAPSTLQTPVPEPAQMAYAEPPPLADLPLAGQDEQARVTGHCASARRELRFEMLSATDPYPRPRRNPVVCLAVYRPSGGAN